MDKLNSMTGADRLVATVELLQEKRSFTIEALAEHFDVSKETIRRDIKELESKNLATKVHGGVRVNDSVTEPPYHKRVNLNADQKRIIGQKAAELVGDRMTLFIDDGTTSYWFAKSLSNQKNLLIITNSIEVASALLGKNDWRVVIIGGQLDTEYRATFGHEAMAQARRFIPDIVFLSVGAIDHKTGFLDFSLDEADFKRSLLANSRKNVILSDASKFSRAGAVHLANFSEIDVLICDETPPNELYQSLVEAKTEVITVS
jgi:DeoR family glycerol-3-phosphate regulon repressor